MALTGQTLGAMVAAQKAEAAALKSTASFHVTMGQKPPLSIEFRPNPHSRVGFSAAQFCHYTLEPNQDTKTAELAPERLTIGFSTADVTILGARLAPIVEALNAGNLEWVAKVGERYANADQRPWVGEITFGRFDQK